MSVTPYEDFLARKRMVDPATGLKTVPELNLGKLVALVNAKPHVPRVRKTRNPNLTPG